MLAFAQTFSKVERGPVFKSKREMLELLLYVSSNVCVIIKLAIK